MGVQPGIDMDRFPKQGDWICRKVRVVFNYDTSREIGGVIVREDVAEPFRTIIRLDDGRFVLATECMYSLDREEKKQSG